MSTFVQLQTGEVHWIVRCDARAALLGDDHLNLDRWLQSGQATIVKNGPHRTVYRLRLPGHHYYLKHYRVPDTRAMLSQWTQGSKGYREWTLMQRAARHGVPTLVPVAFGEQRRAGLVLENFLITEGVDEVEPLYSFAHQLLPTVPADRQRLLRRQLALDLAEMAARMHEAGIQHRDLHGGNVLVQPDPAGRLRLFLIDLHGARVRRHMDWRRSRAEILVLAANFLGVASATDRLRFLRRYLELRPSLRLTHRAVARELYARMWRRARMVWWRRNALCVSNNRRFLYRDIGTAHGFAVSELGEERLLALLRDPDSPLVLQTEEQLKNSNSSMVAKLTIPIAGQATPVIYKRYNCPKSLDPVRALLYRTPAMRAWVAGHGLLLRGIPTPRPIAVLERKRYHLIRESYLITERIDGARSLKQHMLEVIPSLPAEQRRQRVRWLAVRLGQLVRRLHERQISHRDMKGSNILITPGTDHLQHEQLYLIDLDAVQIWRRLPARRRNQNLARIWVSLGKLPGVQRTDWLRFLRAYLPGGLRSPTAWKSLWNEIGERGAHKIAQNRTRGRIIG
jgi:tRNA A-37 threonylcarbamoyl transferase component Bud32